LPLISQISKGFNEKKPPSRSAAVADDISKAFDTVNITLLLEMISDSDLNHNYVRWLAAYLRGRSATCIYQESQSHCLRVHKGVPQGSVISPALFNYFMSDFLVTSDLKLSFVDDFHVAATGANIIAFETKLNSDMEAI
jgi:retron-type reverse transcriptase